MVVLAKWFNPYSFKTWFFKLTLRMTTLLTYYRQGNQSGYWLTNLIVALAVIRPNGHIGKVLHN